MIKNLEKFGEAFENVDLKNYNTYRVSSKVKYLVLPNSVCDLQKLIKHLNETNTRFMILGNGSNIILCNNYYDGVMIKLDKLNNMELEGLFVSVEAGVMLPKLVQLAVDNNLKGLEWAHGIPGTVGGSIKGNAGAYKSDISEYLLSVTVIDPEGDIKTFKKSEIEFKYRYSSFKNKLKDYVIISALVGLLPGDKEESLNLIADRRRRRLETQPLDYPSAGSVFRNPDGDAAGRIIEQEINFKGKRIGGAEISQKHANFIINVDNATGNDIKELIELTASEVKEKTGIELILEQEYINWE